MGRGSIKRNPSSVFTLWVSKSVSFVKDRANLAKGVSSKKFNFDGILVNNSTYCASPDSPQPKMEAFVNQIGVVGGETEEVIENEGEIGMFMKFNEEENGESSSSSNFLSSEVILSDEHRSIGDSSSPISEKDGKSHFDSRESEKQESYLSEIEMMKERFSKLLLGEDMSGCGNGVCTALAISNAITNLFATLFGQVWRLEPLPSKKKLMWRREMDCLLSVSDHIVELIPSWQTIPDGRKLEIMTSRPRLDLYVNLPALRKLDHMLLEILESFEGSEFWYVDQGIVAPEADGSSSFRKPLPHQEDKWWLPVPRIPPGGLGEDARKILQHKRDCTNQILKAAMAINSASLAEMNVPDSYLETLPKNGKTCLGGIIHRYINSDQFSPECLLEYLDVSSEHHGLDISNRVEAAIYLWRRRTSSKASLSSSRSNSRSSWGIVKDLVKDADRRELLADRAENLLLCIKQRFPGLQQTTLDTSKIQYNKDVGKSILESYSRVLESLAFNIVARIDDLLYVDDLSKHSDHPMTISKVGMITHKNAGISLPVTCSPYKTAFTTPIFSPSQLPIPAKGSRSPYIESNKLSLRMFGVKGILMDYMSTDGKGKEMRVDGRRSNSSFRMNRDILESPSLESSGCSKGGSSRSSPWLDEDE